MKGYSTFPRAIGLESHNQMVWCHIQDTHWIGEESYLSVEIQSTYSTPPADSAKTSDMLLLSI